VDRRRFLGTGSLAPLVLTDPETKGARMPVVDTHVHCFAGRGDDRFPYHPNAPYRPDAPATPEQLLRAMDAAGVDHAVIVHPEPYQDDHRYLEHCLAAAPKRLKGTCLFFADRPDAPARLKELAGRCALIAVRVHAYAPERLPPFGKPELTALWRQAADLGLAVQLHFEPRYAPPLEPLIQAFPNTTVLIDHLGRPFQGTPEEHERVVRWARFPNTVLKLSAVPVPEQYPHRDVRPFVRRLAEAFGPGRMMYGGGFHAGADGAGYRAERERVARLLDGFSEADQAAVLGGTAARLFRFGPG
jgi:predicted TIM-barrel fold metal-dependent hydrolase